MDLDLTEEFKPNILKANGQPVSIPWIGEVVLLQVFWCEFKVENKLEVLGNSFGNLEKHSI